MTLLAVALGICNVLFCTAVLATGLFRLGLTIGHGLRTLAAVTLVFSSQATFYVVRERKRLWSSSPSRYVVLSSLFDICLIALLAGRGLLMHALPWPLIGVVLLAAAAFALLLDLVKCSLVAPLRLT